MQVFQVILSYFEHEKKGILAVFSSSLRFAFLFFVLKKPLFRKFSSNFFAALENLMMFLNFGLDNLNLEKNKNERVAAQRAAG